MAKNSNVETFCAMRLFIDSWRWEGVPWYLRSGKYLAETATEVLVKLKPPPQRLFRRLSAAGRPGQLPALPGLPQLGRRHRSPRQTRREGVRRGAARGSTCSRNRRERKRPTNGSWATPWPAMEHSSLVRTRWRPPGRWSIQSSRGTTGLALRAPKLGAERGRRDYCFRRRLAQPHTQGGIRMIAPAVSIDVKRADAELAPDPTRVLLPSSSPAMFRDWRGLSLGSCRSPKITSGRCWTRFPQSSPDATSRSASFSRNDSGNCEKWFPWIRTLRAATTTNRSDFVSEFSVESAALFNPSMVVDPDQQGLPPGAFRFVLSLRATGDGSISSIVFRTGIIHADHRIEVRAATCCIVEQPIPNALYEKPLFERKILELGLTNEHTRRVMERLGDSFTEQELQSTIETELKEGSTPEGEKDRQDTAQRISILAKSNCSFSF